MDVMDVMDVIVCIRRVPDLADAELEIDREGRSIEQRDLAYTTNEWDDFAVETAVRLKELHGARVCAVTVGDGDAEEVLRRALAMGADQAVHLIDPAFEGADARGLATILCRAIAARPHDLVLTGAVSADEGRGQVGGMLAGLLGVPSVALVTDLTVAGRTVRARHEVEAGLERVVEVDLPALCTVQTGGTEPRYVSIRGIRKVAGQAIEVLGAAELGLDDGSVGRAAADVELDELFLPPRGAGAEILQGSPDAVARELAERLCKGGGL